MICHFLGKKDLEEVPTTKKEEIRGKIIHVYRNERAKQQREKRRSCGSIKKNELSPVDDLNGIKKGTPFSKTSKEKVK